MMSYNGNMKASMISTFAFDPQDYTTECGVIEKFNKIAQDLIASGDIKVILAQYINKFLT